MTVDPKHQMLMREVLQQLESGDWDAIAQHPGLHETLESFPTMLSAFPDLNQTFEQEFSQGEMYAYVIKVTGTHQGELMGIPPSGKKVSFQLIGIERIIDGKIVHHNAIPDFFSLFLQVGMINPDQAF